MSYYTGDVFYTEFVSSNVNGVASNMDAAPVAHFWRNSVDDFSVNVFVNNIDVGRYALSGLIPNYSLPSTVGVVVSGYMNGNLQKGVFDLGSLNRPVSVTGTLPQVIVASGGLDNIIIDGNTNFRQAIAVMASVIAGSSTVNGDFVNYFALNNNAIQRVSACAISGARQSIVLLLP